MILKVFNQQLPSFLLNLGLGIAPHGNGQSIEDLFTLVRNTMLYCGAVKAYEGSSPRA